MPDRELSPAEEEAVRRELAAARHTAPMPPGLVTRMDDVIAGLQAERAPASRDSDDVPDLAPVLPLASRRRRRATQLLVAAAAVVVVGVGFNTVTNEGSPFPAMSGGSGDQAVQEGGADAGAAESHQDAAGRDAGGQTPYHASPSGGPTVMRRWTQLGILLDLGYPVTVGPTAEVPTGAASPFSGPGSPGEEELRSSLESTVRELSLRSQILEARRDAIASEGARTGTSGSPGRLGPDTADQSQSSCGWPGDGELMLRAVYEGRRAVLLFRQPSGGAQRVDLYLCTRSGPVHERSSLISAP